MTHDENGTGSSWAPPSVSSGPPAPAGYPAYVQQSPSRMPPPAPRQPQPSSRRVAAGVLTIPLIMANGLGTFTMYTGAGIPTSGLLTAVMVLWILLSVGVLAAGIMLLIQRRGRGTGVPKLLLGSTAALIIVGITAALLREAIGPALFSMLFGIPILILVITRMKHEAAERTVLEKGR